jgi:hypothetical protein
VLGAYAARKELVKAFIIRFMTVSPGTRLGPYEVLSAIGAGGPPSLAHRLHASFGEARHSHARTVS